MLPQVSAAKNGARRRQSTVISLDRIEENLENDDGIEDVLSDDSEIDDEGKVGIIDEKSWKTISARISFSTCKMTVTQA